MIAIEQDNNKIKFIAILIFLFPIAGVGVRHWFSGIATFLVLFGIYFIISKSIRIKNPFSDYSKDEKILSFLIAALFLSYLISGFVNGWNANQLDYFMGEMNFLFFIPLYFIIRKVTKAPELIIKGTVIAGIFFSTSYIYDLYILKAARITGVYGYLFIGPIAVIFFFITISSYKYLSINKFWKILIFISIVVSFLTVVESKSGTAYSLILLMCLVLPFIITRNLKNRLLIYVTLVLILFASYNFNNDVKTGILRVTNSAELFLSINNLRTYQGILGTSGDRMAMWVSSWIVFKDNIFFGVGRGNYNKSMREYADQGKVRHDMINYGHPHNIYFEILVSKGLLGISIFFLLIIHILRKYMLAWKKKIIFNEAALLHILAILLVGIGSIGPVFKNNYISIFLLYIAVFYSHFDLILSKEKSKSE